MKNLIMSGTTLLCGIAIGASVGNIKTDEEKIILNETTTYIQDMKEWMYEDKYNGVIHEDYVDYYIEGLDTCEDLLIKLDSITN